MRPLSLALEGFTAFRDRQEIDFEPLNLFVITGPTGAGKTSILDAMVFALYGQVPRLGGKHGTTDLVSLGRAEARVLLEFSIDGKGRYRVARRLSRRAGQSATLERHDGSDWVSICERGGVRECDRALKEILVLEFDSFCKAVVLPQGEFHKFLKGDTAERRQMLVSLLGVGYFQKMAEMARSRRARLVAGVDRTEEIIAEQYADATADAVAVLQGAAGAAADQAVVLTKSLAEANAHSAQATEGDRRSQALSTTATDIDELVRALRSQAGACRTAEEAQVKAAQALSSAAAALEARRKDLTAADRAVAELEADSGTLEHLAGVAAASRTVRAATTEKSEAHERHSEASADEASALAALGEAQGDADQSLVLLKGAVAAEGASRTTAEGAERRRLGLERAHRDAAARSNELGTARDKVDAARAAAANACAAAEEHRLALVQVSADFEEHRRAHLAAELAAGLTSGDPCPVCERPLTSPVTIAEEASGVLEGARATEVAARKAADEAARQAARHEAAVHAAEESVPVCENRLEEALAGHADVPSLGDAADEAGVEASKAGEELVRAQANRDIAQGQRDAALERAGAASTELARCKAVTDAAVGTHKSVEKRRLQARAELEQHFGGEPPENADEHVAAQRSRLTAMIAGAEEARTGYAEVAQVHDSARDDAEAAERSISAIDVELTRLGTRAEGTSRSASEALDGAVILGPVPSAKGARETLATALAGWCEATGVALSAARDDVVRARDAAREKMVAIARAHDLAAPSAERALALLGEAERVASGAAVRAQNDADQAIQRAKERADLEDRIKSESEQIVVLGDLANELRADRFGEYIVQETLDLLAVHASDELLRISDGRYSLVPVDGDFQVVDHANADERRSVKTLSGGETFLASLALALALSRHIGELATEGLGAKLEAVFIDEGFGTLDPETLEEVIDALERLREDDLLVGVISHVPMLAQRVRAGLEVQKEEGRSRVIQAAAA